MANRSCSICVPREMAGERCFFIKSSFLCSCCGNVFQWQLDWKWISWRSEHHSTIPTKRCHSNRHLKIKGDQRGVTSSNLMCQKVFEKDFWSNWSFFPNFNLNNIFFCRYFCVGPDVAMMSYPICWFYPRRSQRPARCPRLFLIPKSQVVFRWPLWNLLQSGDMQTLKALYSPLLTSVLMECAVASDLFTSCACRIDVLSLTTLSPSTCRKSGEIVWISPLSLE